MKKTLILILSSFVLNLSPVYAYANCSLEQNLAQQGTLNATGEVLREVLPDTVVLNFQITSKDKDPKKALSENKIKAIDVKNKLNSYLDKTLGDFVQTSDFSLNPRYTYVDKKQKLDYYIATHTVTLESHKINKSGEFIDLAVEAGADRVNNISFKLKNKDLHCQELLKEAAKKAKNQAQAVAESMGVKVGKIKKINYNCYADNDRPYFAPRMMMASGMEEAKSSAPIMPKDVKLRVSINVEFYIED